MNESGWTRSVHKLLPKEVYWWKISDRFTSGIPDAYYSGNATEAWVEYKYLHKFPKSLKPALSELQRTWLNERHAQGRNVFVVVGSPTGAVIFTSLTWNTSTTDYAVISKKQLAEWITALVTKKNSPQIQSLR